MASYPWLLPVAAYLYGSVPFGFLAARLIKGVDIRRTGSGNIGATNAARVLGFKFFPPIFLLDLSKGLVPTLAAAALLGAGRYDPHPMVVGTGLAAVLGHVFPVYLGFKGGKAVATSTGFFLVLCWPAVAVAAGVWLLVFGLWRYVSLASISAAATLPVAACLFQEDPFGTGLFLSGVAIFAAAFVVYLHRGNIGRLLAGTEDRIGAEQSEQAAEGRESRSEDQR